MGEIGSMFNIQDLAKRYDDDTLSKNRNKVINLVGDYNNSKFFDSIARKAKRLGIVTVYNESSDRFKTVVDVETADTSMAINPYNDIDHVATPGLSAVAEGVYRVILGLNDGSIAGKHIVIIGRHHAVKGLADALVDSDATVTIMHSKSVGIIETCNNADMIITSTNNINLSTVDNTKVINIAAGTPAGLSSLTTSILLNRCVQE